MEKTVSSKKFYLTIFSLITAMIVILGGIVGIWAASSQSLSSLFTINYSVGTNIATRITAYYQFEGDESLSSLGSFTQNVDGSQEGEIAAVDLTFTPEKTLVRFVWLVENIGESPFGLGFFWPRIDSYTLNPDTNKYMKNIYWSFDGFSTTGYAYGTYAGLDQIPSEITRPTSFGSSGLPNATYVDASHPCVVILNISVADVNKNAYLICDGTSVQDLRLHMDQTSTDNDPSLPPTPEKPVSPK